MKTNIYLEINKLSIVRSANDKVVWPVIDIQCTRLFCIDNQL